MILFFGNTRPIGEGRGKFHLKVGSHDCVNPFMEKCSADGERWIRRGIVVIRICFGFTMMFQGERDWFGCHVWKSDDYFFFTSNPMA